MAAPDRKIPDRVKLAAEQLFKEAGSKNAAIEAILALPKKGSPGRPKGWTSLLLVDMQMMQAVEEMQFEYHRSGQPKSRRDLIREVVDICWDNEDEPFCSAVRQGKTKKAVVARLAKRPHFFGIVVQAFRQHRPELLKYLPADVDDQIRAMDPDKPNMAFFLPYLLAAAMRYPKVVEALSGGGHEKPASAVAPPAAE